MGFLQQFQMNSLLSNVNLQFYHCNVEDVLAFLTKVLPMITTINSITDNAGPYDGVGWTGHAPPPEMKKNLKK
jgi:hypothetical protein